MVFVLVLDLLELVWVVPPVVLLAVLKVLRLSIVAYWHEQLRRRYVRLLQAAEAFVHLVLCHNKVTLSILSGLTHHLLLLAVPFLLCCLLFLFFLDLVSGLKVVSKLLSEQFLKLLWAGLLQILFTDLDQLNLTKFLRLLDQSTSLVDCNHSLAIVSLARLRLDLACRNLIIIFIRLFAFLSSGLFLGRGLRQLIPFIIQSR